MDKRVDERLARELAKLKRSIVEFSKALSQKTIKIPLATEEEEKLKKERENEKQNEIPKKLDSRNILVQRVDSMRKGAEIITKGLGNCTKLSKSKKSIRQFTHKKLAECNEDELLEALKHAIDVLAQIVKPFSSYDYGFVFNKATIVSLNFKAVI